MEEFDIASYLAYVPMLLAAICALTVFGGTFFTVEQQTAAIVQRMGKFARIAQPGLNFKIPFIESVAGTESFRVQQLDVEVETKTKDNVFVTISVAVQYFVQPSRVFEAFYKLDNHEGQIEAYVFDVVRAKVPTLDLDDLFERKDDIADAVKAELAETMQDFGYSIVKALVVDIDPDEKVKEAMNEINAAQRQRVAANEKGEAEKILVVKAAEADAESKELEGRGIAKQRRAIIDGLRDSLKAFESAVPDVSSKEVMDLMMMTQYFDAMKDVAKESKTNTIFLPHGPGVVSDLMTQLLAANSAGKKAA